jgi:TonB family protein
MADPWVRPTPPGLPDPGDSPRPEDTRISFEKVPSADDYLLIDRLREDAASGHMDLSSILSEVTHAARYFTDANGAALALWSQGVVICRARSGETAPPLGTKLDVDSGISGECLRTGHAQRCQDTETDPRIDPELCREMSIRSIAVVPLPGAQGVIGILEVFSEKANAFSDAHITLLKKLAQIAVTSRARSMRAAPGPTAPLEVAPVSRPSSPEQNLIVLPPLPEPERFAFLPARMRGEEGQPLRLAAAALLLLILGIAGWMVSRTRGGSARSGPSVHAASQAVPDLMAAGNTSGRVSNAGGVTSSSPQPAASTITLTGSIKPRADVVAGEVVHKAATSVVVERTPPATSAGSGAASAAPASSSPSAAESDAPAPDPAQVLSGTDQAVPQSLVNPQPVFPFVAVPVSRGVTGGRLMRRVDPFYPSGARLQRIEGSVTLDALVGEDGHVKQIQVTSGPPTLARAASEAVKQWRYEPYLLNGKPVAIHNQITIQFKLP